MDNSCHSVKLLYPQVRVRNDNIENLISIVAHLRITPTNYYILCTANKGKHGSSFQDQNLKEDTRIAGTSRPVIPAWPTPVMKLFLRDSRSVLKVAGPASLAAHEAFSVPDGGEGGRPDSPLPSIS